MADIVKDTYDQSKGQESVVFQQKKPLLNYELNLANEILSKKIKETNTLSILTNYNGDSFKVYESPSQHKVMVSKGVFYHEGQPICLTVDKEVDMVNYQNTGNYTIYVEWYLKEVDGEVDSNIGFVTTREKRLFYDIKVSSLDAPPSASNEHISFDSSNSSIRLTQGYFPNWLRIPGTKFKTNSLINFDTLTVSSSPDDKTLIVEESLTDENLVNLEFYEYAGTSKIVPNTFKAYRKNILPLARVSRTYGTPHIDEADIMDLRDKSVYNFVSKGAGKVTDHGGLSVAISSGEVWVGDQSFYIEEGVDRDLSLSTSSLNYIYVENTSGYVEVSDVEPTDFHVMLAEVQIDTVYGYIANIIDRRSYRPLAWDNKYNGNAGTGETGKESISVQYKAAEDLLKGDVVGFTGDRSVGKVKASSSNMLPAIGLAAQKFAAGQKDNIVVFGEISLPTWNWTSGEDVYIDIVSGELTQSPSMMDGYYLQRIGVATNTTTVFVKPDLTFTKIQDINPNEARLITLRDDGTQEIMGKGVKINTDRSSFLASIATGNATTFRVLPGRYYVQDTEVLNLENETTVDLSTTVTANAPAAGKYNKIAYTITADNNNTPVINSYESLPEDDADSVLEPEIPDNELPLCTVSFMYSPLGTPMFISQEDIADRRVWLNLGNVDNSAFKPLYRNNEYFMVQKGSAWFNNVYITLPKNLLIEASRVSLATYYIYLDTDSLVGTKWFKTTPTNNPELSIYTTTDGFSLVDRRRYIPLGMYTVQNIDGNHVINKDSFLGFQAKFLQYRDAPYTDVYSEVITQSTERSVFNVSSSFTFINADYLDIEINGIKYYENDDYIKSQPATITFGFRVKEGALVKIKKV